MENETVYKKVCSIFYYYKNTKTLIYYGNGSTYQNLLFLLCFLEEKGRIKFNCIEELWFLKEIKNQSLNKLILDLIKSLISIIEDKDFNLAQANINSATALLELNDSETFEIFKYFQSICSNLTNETLNIIYPIIYTIMFNKPQLKKYLKRDFMEIVKVPLEQLGVDDKIQYNNINKKFLKYFNALLNLKEEEMKLECYKYLCKFNDNEKYKEVDFSESFSYFSSLKEIIINYEKKLIENKSINSDELINKNGKNINNTTSDKTDNNNSSERHGSNNGSNNSGTAQESSIYGNEIETSEKSAKKSSIHKTINRTINKESINGSNSKKQYLGFSTEDKDKINVENSKEINIKLNKEEKETENKINEGKEPIEHKKEDKARLNNENNDMEQTKKDELKEHLPAIQLMIKVIMINNYCLKIPYIINSLKINIESVERYYDLVIKNTENKLLLNKLSTTILILQNANIINLKRKLVECMIFGILEKYSDTFSFESNNIYYPSMNHLDELLKIIQKRKSLLPKNCDKSKKEKIESDIAILQKMIKDNKEPKINSKIKIQSKNLKTYNKLKMVLDFLRFCKKKLHPMVHAEGKNIDYYLLTNDLFNSNLKRSDILFSLDDMIDKKNIKKSEIKFRLQELEIDENLDIYIDNKEISCEEALKILMSQKTVSLNDKNQVKNLDEIKEKLNKALETYNVYYNAFIQNSFTSLPEELMDSIEINNEEKDLVDLVNQYENNILMILENKIEKSKAVEMIKSIIQTVKDETKSAMKCFFKLAFSDSDSFIELLNSKIKRVCIIAKFLEEQSKKFSERQKEIYDEFDNSAQKILKKSETLRNLIQDFVSEEKENLFDKWIETGPEFDEEYLNVNWMKNYIKDLILSVKLDIRCNFEEKFFLWMVKNNFSQYLKNDF